MMVDDHGRKAQVCNHLTGSQSAPITDQTTRPAATQPDAHRNVTRSGGKSFHLRQLALNSFNRPI
jgi:hypothetical protein